MADAIFTYKEFTITVNPNMILIDKAKIGRKVYATLIVDRLSKQETFSGEFPYVTRDDFIHVAFRKIIELIGTSTKVVLAKEKQVISILDSIKK